MAAVTSQCVEYGGGDGECEPDRGRRHVFGAVRRTQMERDGTDRQQHQTDGSGDSDRRPQQAAADRLVREGDVVDAAGMSFLVRETPGHSSGHVVFISKDQQPWVVFGGDVLFQGSIGRADFPDGDFDQLFASIRDKLFTLPEETEVYPGHGEPTTIGEEMETNPYVGRQAM